MGCGCEGLAIGVDGVGVVNARVVVVRIGVSERMVTFSYASDCILTLAPIYLVIANDFGDRGQVKLHCIQLRGRVSQVCNYYLPQRQTATAADATHHTGMHSCYHFIFLGFLVF